MGFFICRGARPLVEDGARGAKGRGVPSDVGDDAFDPDDIVFESLKTLGLILVGKLIMQDHSWLDSNTQHCC